MTDNTEKHLCFFSIVTEIGDVLQCKCGNYCIIGSRANQIVEKIRRDIEISIPNKSV